MKALNGPVAQLAERRADTNIVEREGTGIDAQLDQLPQYVSSLLTAG